VINQLFAQTVCIAACAIKGRRFMAWQTAGEFGFKVRGLRTLKIIEIQKRALYKVGQKQIFFISKSI
jgi:hypothetical protein